MKSVQLLLVLGTAVVAVAWLVFSLSPARPKPAAASPLDELVVGQPLIFQNLVVFPVSSRSPRQTDRFITLDEGLKAGTVEILERSAAAAGVQPPAPDPFAAPAQPAPAADPFAPPTAPAQPPTAANPPAEPGQLAAETGNQQPRQQAGRGRGGNDVNELLVVNHSDKPLYLMPGEIIIGGDQDRTIAEEIVIAPGKTPTPIPVFCVEHGRWGGRDRGEYARIIAQTAASITPHAWNEENRASGVDLRTGGASAADFSSNLSLDVSAAQIAEQANSGKFVGSVGSVNKSVRVAVQAGEGQSKVWDEVASQNAKAAVGGQTGTFTGNYSEAQSAERLTPFLKQLQEPVNNTPNIVGVIVAVNGKVESMDVFESTPLFQKLWPKLLKSYALDASSADPAAGEARPLTVEDARGFMSDVASAGRKSEETKGDLALSRSESDAVLAFSAHERRGPAAAQPAPMMGSGGGFFGGAVHSAGYRK